MRCVCGHACHQAWHPLYQRRRACAAHRCTCRRAQQPMHAGTSDGTGCSPVRHAHASAFACVCVRVCVCVCVGVGVWVWVCGCGCGCGCVGVWVWVCYHPPPLGPPPATHPQKAALLPARLCPQPSPLPQLPHHLDPQPSVLLGRGAWWACQRSRPPPFPDQMFCTRVKSQILPL